MMRTMLKSKIHRARVTDANLHYEGSITLDPVLMDAADLRPFEQVHLLDIDNGARLETYVIEGRRGSGEVVVNGAAAQLIHTGDTIIVVGDHDGQSKIWAFDKLTGDKLWEKDRDERTNWATPAGRHG